jgi:hypothetical protein
MTITAKRLATAQVGTSVAALYTAASGTRTVVKRAAFCNTSGSSVTLTVHLVPPGGSVGDSNKVVSAQSVSSGETYLAAEVESQVIEGTGSLQASASASGSISAIVSGLEIT